MGPPEAPDRWAAGRHPGTRLGTGLAAQLPKHGFPLGTYGKFPQEMVNAANEQMDNFVSILEKRGIIGDRVTVHPYLADERSLPMAQIALAWMLAKPVVASPIIGATKASHIDQAVASVSLKLTAEEIQRLDDTYQRHPVLGFNKIWR